MKNYLLIVILICISSITSFSQVFKSKQTLYTNANGLSGWYTGNEYSSVDSYKGNVYFVMLDTNRRPYIGKIVKGVTTIEALDKVYPNYVPINDGHQEFSIGIDRDGYIHVTGDMHNFPNGDINTSLPTAYKSANILYWKSKSPEDISDFKFIGLTPAETIPGSDWSYGRFVTDRNHKLYYISRTLARKNYYQNGGRGLGLYSYDETAKSWKAYGKKAPISDASYPVIAWEESGQAAGSYQQYKGDICFDTNNRMYFTTGMNTQNGNAQMNSVVFAYSDDGGQTFKKASGDSISLPMQIASGSRQGDVVDVEPTGTFEQPSVTYAFDNKPIIQYTANGNHYYKYWTGTAWSSRITSPCNAMRGRVLFNDYESKLYFVNISTGTIYSKSSFTGTTESYSAGETMRAFNPKLFKDENILDFVSWKASTGKFQVIRLYGDTSLVKHSTSIKDLQKVKNGGFSIYPNPTSNYLNLTFAVSSSNTTTRCDISILNAFGQVVYLSPTTSSIANQDINAFKIDVNQLPSGLYYIKVGEQFSKFIKQ